MIDDYERAMALKEQMETQLPIPARPTGALVRIMQAQGAKLDRDQELEIKRVLYAGDEGGITCDVTPPGLEDKAVLCSLTHLRVSPKHPLGAEIRAYQRERTSRLAREGRESATFTLEPRKRRRH